MDVSQYYVTKTYTGPDPALVGTKYLFNDLLNWGDKCDESALLNRSEAQAFAANMNARFGPQFAYTSYSIERAVNAGREIRVTIRKQLGIDVAVPVNESARILAKIAGMRTLELETLAMAAQLGHTIELTPDAELGRLYDAIAILSVA